MELYEGGDEPKEEPAEDIKSARSGKPLIQQRLAGPSKQATTTANIRSKISSVLLNKFNIGKKTETIASVSDQLVAEVD